MSSQRSSPRTGRKRITMTQMNLFPNAVALRRTEIMAQTSAASTMIAIRAPIIGYSFSFI
jgi:hypothetical protein